MQRIALWSGPRNLSTALMRSFSSRTDCVVSDEPFYAAYLDSRPDLDHPGRDEVIASQPTDWTVVARDLTTGQPPLPRPVWYQKHMAHHMRPEMLGPWLDSLTHAFLIRHPGRVIASYAKVDNRQFRLLKAATPGSYAFILQATREVPKRLQHPSRRTIGLRIPDHKVVRALLTANWAAMPGLRFSATGIFHSDDGIAVETHTIGEREGKPVDMMSVNLFLFEGDQLVCERCYFDQVTTAQNLGG